MRVIRQNTMGSWNEPDRLSHQEDSGKEGATSGQGEKQVL